MNEGGYILSGLWRQMTAMKDQWQDQGIRGISIRAATSHHPYLTVHQSLPDMSFDHRVVVTSGGAMPLLEIWSSVNGQTHEHLLPIKSIETNAVRGALMKRLGTCATNPTLAWPPKGGGHMRAKKAAMAYNMGSAQSCQPV